MARLAQASPPLRRDDAPTSARAARSEALKPYVPRLVIDWLRSTPEARHRQVEGSLAFVDISGFTKLTERLARKGKVGAEEVNDALDYCFTELLSVAYDFGAGLVKWGGDAVLLLFDRDRHAERACCAAAGMQRTIRDVGRLTTSAGPVTLRMSVGIHSGAFDFFIVGESHRELVITGPAASRTVLMEQLADAGQVALSATTAAALETPLLGRLKGEAVLLRRPPPLAVDRAAPVPDVSELELEQCLPVGIREQLLAGGEAEHRPVTAAFIEFSGADELLAEEGPESVADALEECIRTVQRAAARHQITFFETDISLGGGKIMLVAGAPTSTGNHEERMLRAVREIADAPNRLPLRIGVNSGRVFAGDFGPPYRRTYSVKGDAVNLAARLMSKARPGQILTTDAVLSRSRAAFETEQLGPFHVKGKAQPVQGYSVGPLFGARQRPTQGSPLVGRASELSALLSAVESARNWEGQLAEIVGDPGMGKSRLLEEVRARAEGVLALEAVCEEYEASTPYFVFRGLLRSLLDLPDGHGARAARGLRERVEELAPHLLPWLPLLAIPLDLELPPTPETERLEQRFRKQRLEEATRELLGIVLSTPTLLVLEDVHWLDDASSDLLRALAEGLELRPWLIVATRRIDGAGFVAPAGGRVLTLRLEPLSGDDAAALAEAATDDSPLPPHVVAELAQRSGGNPLFLAELTSAAREAGAVDELPSSVEGLLAAQIDRLTASDRTLLRSAAVLGVSFDRELLASALGEDAERLEDDVWQRLTTFVVPGGGDTLRFRHALVRDAAYEGLPYRRRRELHARVGEAIERSAAPRPEDQAELLSLHFLHAQRFQDAWRYARVAGERASAIYANVEAAAFFERALEAARRLEELPTADVAEVSESLGDVRQRLGQFGEASAAFAVARSLHRGDPVALAGLLLKSAQLWWRIGNFPPALRSITRGLRVLEGVESLDAARLRAQLAVEYGQIRQRQGRLLEAIPWCELGLELARAAGERDALAHAYYILDWTLVRLGRFEHAVYSPQALAIYEELGAFEKQAAVLNNMGGRAYWEGRWNEALELYERARAAWEKVGDHWAASVPTMNIGEILSDQGRFEDSAVLLERTLRIWKASRASEMVAFSQSLLGRLAARVGRFEEADQLFREARAQYVAASNPDAVLETDARFAEALLLRGDASAALALASETLAGARRSEGASGLIPLLQRIRGYALLLDGDLDGARRDLEESLAGARRQNADFELAQTLAAFIRLEKLCGRAFDSLDEERRVLAARLGLVAAPEVPLRERSPGAANSRSRAPA